VLKGAKVPRRRVEHPREKHKMLILRCPTLRIAFALHSRRLKLSI
jgi:hypothetical protein